MTVYEQLCALSDQMGEDWIVRRGVRSPRDQPAENLLTFFHPASGADWQVRGQADRYLLAYKAPSEDAEADAPYVAQWQAAPLGEVLSIMQMLVACPELITPPRRSVPTTP